MQVYVDGIKSEMPIDPPNLHLHAGNVYTLRNKAPPMRDGMTNLIFPEESKHLCKGACYYYYYY